MNPEKKFSAGALSATIWLNETEKEGLVKTYRTISFDRRYKDKQDNWKSTNSLRINDLPKAVLLLQKAYEYVTFNSAAIII